MNQLDQFVSYGTYLFMMAVIVVAVCLGIAALVFLFLVWFRYKDRE